MISIMILYLFTGYLLGMMSSWEFLPLNISMEKSVWRLKKVLFSWQMHVDSFVVELLTLALSKNAMMIQSYLGRNVSTSIYMVISNNLLLHVKGLSRYTYCHMVSPLHCSGHQNVVGSRFFEH